MAVIGGEPQERRRKGGQEEVDCSLAPYMRLLQVHVCTMYGAQKKDLDDAEGFEVQVINHVIAGAAGGYKAACMATEYHNKAVGNGMYMQISVRCRHRWIQFLINSHYNLAVHNTHNT